MEILFWVLTLFVVYTYIGYPSLILFASKIKNKKVNNVEPSDWPTVTIIIAARDEEKNIKKRLKNLVDQNYPAEKIEIIIVSDGSQDSTNKIVRQFGEQYEDIKVQKVVLIDYSPGRGKPYALNMGVIQANGEIIVFTDARQRFQKNAVQNLVKNFSDPKVGAVSGELILTNENDASKVEMGAYWKYEKLIRKSESQFDSVVGATGAIYAIRKEHYTPIPESILLDDVLIPMKVVLKGYRVVFESTAIAYDHISQNTQQEWRRKIRTLAGNWQLVSMFRELILPMKNRIYFEYYSHKIFRLIVPFTLPIIFILGMVQNGLIYSILTWMQVGLYASIVTGQILPFTRKLRIISLCYFFGVMNAAAVAGFWYWVTGQCNQIWKPAYKLEKGEQ